MNITESNIAEAKRALTEKPMQATSVERVLILNDIKSKYGDLPQPRRFSATLSELLTRVSLPLAEYDLVAGRCVDRELTDEEEQIFQAYIRHPDYPKHRTFLSAGHCTYSWEMVAELGLPGMRALCEEKLAGETDADKRIFLTAIIEIYDAIAAYLLRYAAAARERGMTELAENLRAAATARPERFAVALQLLWVITLINCAYITKNPTLTVGRLDQILYPLYRAELARGTLTRERAAAYITDYYCKHNLIMGRGEHQVGDETNSTTFSRIYCFDAPQYLLLGGTDEQGKDAVNELTELFAACIEPAFKNPVVVVRYQKGMDTRHPALWRTLTQKALASASLMFYNDDDILATWRRMGLPEADARRYAHFGCNWPSPGDQGAWIQGGPWSDQYGAYRSEEERAALSIPYMRTHGEHSWPEIFVEVMRTLAAQEPHEVTIEHFYTLFFERMADFVDRKLRHVSREVAVRRRQPSAVLTFADCFLRGSLESATCFSAGAKYHFELQAFQMFATVADCFIAVDQLVMREEKLTLSELLAAVDADFEGYPKVLALCRRADKYGMDTPLSNTHAERLSHTASTLVIEKSRPYLVNEGLFLVPCMQSDTWHLRYGEGYGATPDGRRAHTPFSQNTRPANGSCTNGLTAMLNAMLHLPADGLLSGALNLDVDTKQFAGEEGRAIFAALLATYFNRGGLHAQVTAVRPEDLVDAQKNPHLYRDLRVRVTGYSGVFVDICRRLQDDIINRLQ